MTLTPDPEHATYPTREAAAAAHRADHGIIHPTTQAVIDAHAQAVADGWEGSLTDWLELIGLTAGLHDLSGVIDTEAARANLDVPSTGEVDDAIAAVSGAKAPRTALRWYGVANERVLCPHRPGLNVAGDLRVRALISEVAEPSGQAAIVGQYDTSRSARSWELLVTVGGSIACYVSADGATAGSAVLGSAIDLQTPLWVELTREVSTGAVALRTSRDGTVWEPYASGVRAPGQPLHQPDVPVYVGARISGGASLDGCVHEVAVYDDDALMASVSFAAPWHPRWSDPAGNIWTMESSTFTWTEAGL